ncbi:DUF1569 domain-containing protein [Dyadobacter tibetensis]|uniref:DUF1569 domain-containing protein n=1 Tax=Dyadobacter tibetensis TaxID=1211851 RepID=UPI000472E372|nr:DUF1569 domain-containing protein [Dyadobacter tibetensis]
MKSIFDPETRKAILARISNISEHDTALWGKMTPYQMVRHCYLTDEMTQGHRQYKRLLIGRLFGSLALKQILKDDRPISKNQPTHPQMKITDMGDLETERNKWLALIEDYAHFERTEMIHPFFGKLNKDQIGRLVFKHTDHHLRQFGK